jgi:hypothetical protein
MTRGANLKLTLTYRPEFCVLDACERTLPELVRMCLPLKLLDLTATP